MRFIDCSTNEPIADTWQKVGDYAASLIGDNFTKEIQVKDTIEGTVYPFNVFRKSKNPSFGWVATPYKTQQILEG